MRNRCSTKVDVRYGHGQVSLRIPDENLRQIIRPWRNVCSLDTVSVVRQALQGEPLDAFRRRIRHTRLCVLIDDGTRDEPLSEILPVLFDALRVSSYVQFVICTGTHSPHTEENKRIQLLIEKAARESEIADFKVHCHDCQGPRFTNLGKTVRGTQILVNALADDVDVFVVVSDVKVHYFAGYSNPSKNFVPGICAYKTAEQNHAFALQKQSTHGVHPWRHSPSRGNNPVAEDQVEGMYLIARDRPVYALVTVSTAQGVHWARFGPVEDVTPVAFELADTKNTHRIEPVSRMIVSPGGWPDDVDLYTAHRALELTSAAVRDGGEVLFLAACPNGVGDEHTVDNFFKRLTAPLPDVIKSIRSEYKLYSHKAYRFAQTIQRLSRIWMYSEVPDDLIQAAHLSPTSEPQAVVDRWCTEDSKVEVTIVDEANRIALYSIPT